MLRKSKTRRLCAILLALVLAFQLAPVAISVPAEGGDYTYDGGYEVVVDGPEDEYYDDVTEPEDDDVYDEDDDAIDAIVPEAEDFSVNITTLGELPYQTVALHAVARGRTAPFAPVTAAGPGAEFTVDVVIDHLPDTAKVGPQGMYGWTDVAFAIMYDPNMVEMVQYLGARWAVPNSAGAGPMCEYAEAGNIGTNRNQPGPGRTTAVFSTFDSVPSFGRGVASFRFRVLDTAPVGSVEFAIEVHTGPSGSPDVPNYIPQLIGWRPINPETDFANVWLGPLNLDVAVTGTPVNPAPADITVEHVGQATIFTQTPPGSNLFRHTSNVALTGDVRVSAPGFVTQTVAIPAYSTTNGVARLDIELVREQTTDPTLGTLEGRVTSAAGGVGIGGATVTVATATGTRTAITNSQGYYIVVDLAPGQVTVLASATNFNAGFYTGNPATITASATTTANITLTPQVNPGYTLIVTVAGPAPADISVTHPSATFTQSGRVFAVTTAAQLTGTVTASALGFVAETATGWTYGADRIARVYLTLVEETPDPGYGQLIGQITNAVGGAGIAGATVTVVLADGTSRTAVTDNAGNYSVNNLAPGPVTVLASATDFYVGFYANNPLTIVEFPPRTTANIALQPRVLPGGYTLIVTVTGPGLDGANVNLAHTFTLPTSTNFTRDGNVFAVTTPAQLVGTITASAAMFQTSLPHAVPTYTNGVARVYINMTEIVLPPGQGGVYGQVLRDADGSPIEDAVVIVLDENGNEVGRTTTDSGGNYDIHPLPPGNYTVVVVRPGYVPQSQPAVVVPDDMTLLPPFRLVPDAPGMNYTLIVILTNIDGAPATVRLNGGAMEATGNDVWSLRSPMNSGPFALHGNVTAVAQGFLPAGPYTVAAGDFVNRVAIVRIELDCEITTPTPVGVLQGFVRRDDDRATGIGGATVTAIHSDGTRTVTTADIDGFYRFTGLAPGTYNVVAIAPRFNIGVAENSATLTDTEGANANVYLVYRGGSTGEQFQLIVNVEPASAVAAGVTVTYLGMPIPFNDGNTWQENYFGPIGGLLEVTAPGFVGETRTLTSANFVNNIAFVTVRLRPVAVEGTLQGYVFEQGTNNRLGGATVTIVNETTGEVRTETANADGFYYFLNLPFGTYTVVGLAEGFLPAAAPDSPVTIEAGPGVDADIYLQRMAPSTENHYVLAVTVVGAPANIVTLETDIAGAAVTFTRVDNVWTATRVTQMLGEVEASAQFFVSDYYIVTAASYVGRTAHVILVLEEVDAVVIFHFDGYTISVPVELGVPMPTADIPVPGRIYGTIAPWPVGFTTPGRFHMGWFTTPTPNHVVTALDRAVPFDLTQNITEAMLTDGVLELWGSRLQFGDLDGNGQVNLADLTAMRMLHLEGLTRDQIVYQAADTTGDGVVNLADLTMLSRYFLEDMLILGWQPS